MKKEHILPVLCDGTKDRNIQTAFSTMLSVQNVTLAPCIHRQKYSRITSHKFNFYSHQLHKNYLKPCIPQGSFQISFSKFFFFQTKPAMPNASMRRAHLLGNPTLSGVFRSGELQSIHTIASPSSSFQSTPPSREATADGGDSAPLQLISIHASLTGGDSKIFPYLAFMAQYVGILANLS